MCFSYICPICGNHQNVGSNNTHTVIKVKNHRKLILIPKEKVQPGMIPIRQSCGNVIMRECSKQFPPIKCDPETFYS